jgi:aminoglycoside phosphotransferase (APT) family kinase protein
VNLEDCLPGDLLPATLTKIGVGQSGAGVYRVEAKDATYVLKVAPAGSPRDEWRFAVAIQRAASAVGVAPQIVHVDEERSSVVSELVVDRGFPTLLMNPATRQDAIQQLGATLRRLHDVPVPESTPVSKPLEALASLWSGLERTALPQFAAHQIERMLAEAEPPADRSFGLSHNDVNPTNFVYDGDRLMLLDWDVAGVNDPLYDLATVSMFLRFDDATCLALLAAHDGQPVAELPARFAYLRRLVATLCGTIMLHFARLAGHPGASEETALTLLEFYGRFRAGAIDMASPDGRWQFGLALIKTAAAH